MNFLQKGLAGLESRLDKVLLDEADRPAPRIAPVPEQRRASGETAMRRSGETGRLGMSMQERLAAAVAAKSGRSSPASRNSSRPPVAGEGGGGGGTSGRRGEETPPPVKKKEVEEKKEMEEAVAVAEVGEEARTEDALPPPIITNGKRESTEEPPDAAPADPIPADSTREELLELISQLREDLQVCETRRQGETHDASERIDALGEKLRYLSQSSASEARSRAVTTPGEKQLSERDEKIALLIEEGERLSKNELKLQTTIKKLRAMAKEGEDAKKRQERAEKLLADERDKVKKAYEAERRAGERIKALGRVQVELEALRSEKNALDGVVRELKEKLDEQTRRAEDAEGKVQTEALESERKNTIELRARMERVQGEAAMTEEKLKGEISNLKHKLERAAEKARIRELQIKGEQSVRPWIHGVALHITR